jgi:hypothetical protein
VDRGQAILINGGDTTKPRAELVIFFSKIPGKNEAPVEVELAADAT